MARFQLGHCGGSPMNHPVGAIQPYLSGRCKKDIYTLMLPRIWEQIFLRPCTCVTLFLGLSNVRVHLLLQSNIGLCHSQDEGGEEARTKLRVASQWGRPEPPVP